MISSWAATDSAPHLHTKQVMSRPVWIWIAKGAASLEIGFMAIWIRFAYEFVRHVSSSADWERVPEKTDKNISGGVISAGMDLIVKSRLKRSRCTWSRSVAANKCRPICYHYTSAMIIDNTASCPARTWSRLLHSYYEDRTSDNRLMDQLRAKDFLGLCCVRCRLANGVVIIYYELLLLLLHGVKWENGFGSINLP